MASVVLHRIEFNDSLPEISQAYYGTERYAAAIYDLNRARIGTNPNNLVPGMSVVLPRIGALA